MRKKLNHELLYNTAIPVFARYGYKRTRMEDIAAELNLATGSIYRYVVNKTDLYNRSLAFRLRNWQQSALDAIANISDPRQKIITFTQAGFNYLQHDSDLRQILIDNPTPLSQQDNPFTEINQDSIKHLKTILNEGINAEVFRPFNVEGIAEVLYALYMTFIIRTYIQPNDIAPDSLLQESFDLFMHGILNQATKATSA